MSGIPEDRRIWDYIPKEKKRSYIVEVTLSEEIREDLLLAFVAAGGVKKSTICPPTVIMSKPGGKLFFVRVGIIRRRL